MTPYSGPIFSMLTRQEANEAIEARHSVRRYHTRELDPDAATTLQKAIDVANTDAGLHIQLILNEPRAFSGIMAYGKFAGVTDYLVMAGPKSPDLDFKIGYQGEQLVLIAQSLGLNTCWAGLSYRKVGDTYTLADGEKIACYIALGYGLTQGVQHRSKPFSQVSNVEESQAPEWFVRGVIAALLAPTAVNQQKFRFEYLGDNRVRAVRLKSLIGYTHMDMGIARLHFEIGANHPFEWID